jgi:hypothetical protein
MKAQESHRGGEEGARVKTTRELEPALPCPGPQLSRSSYRPDSTSVLKLPHNYRKVKAKKKEENTSIFKLGPPQDPCWKKTCSLPLSVLTHFFPTSSLELRGLLEGLLNCPPHHGGTLMPYF